MSLVDLRRRATEPEQLDEGVPEAEALRSLADLRFVNRWLGNRASLLRAVRPHLPPGGRLLDVGCGSGDVPAFLLEHLPGPLLAVGVDVKTLHLRAAPRGRPRAWSPTCVASPFRTGPSTSSPPRSSSTTSTRRTCRRSWPGSTAWPGARSS